MQGELAAGEVLGVGIEEAVFLLEAGRCHYHAAAGHGRYLGGAIGPVVEIVLGGVDAAAVVPFPTVLRAQDLDVVIGGAEFPADVLGGDEGAVRQGGYDGHVGPDVGPAGD